MAPSKTSVPPALPPSVEEAYRRKCMELKQRSKEVDDVNDATRLRIARLKRQVEKLRVERAFLLEQLVKRTSTNVEDSDGSPSPPPTPKEKPLRIKRGSTFINQNLVTLSPSSEAFPQHPEHKDGHHKDLPASRSNQPTTNGVASSLKAPKKPQTAFEMYAANMRDELKSKQESQEDDDDAAAVTAPINVEDELAKSWKKLPDDEKESFHKRERSELEKYEKEKEEYEVQKAKMEKASKSGSDDGEAIEVESDPKGPTDKGIKTELGSNKGDDDEAASNDAPPARDDTKRASQDEDVEMENSDSDQEQAENEA